MFQVTGSEQLPPAWNVQENDSGRTRIRDPTGQTSWIKWFCRSAGGYTVLPPAFPGGHGVSVRNVIANGIDSVKAICYQLIGGNPGPDTLSGKFFVNDNYYYEIFFDGSLLNLNNGDTVRIYAWNFDSTKHGATQGTITERFIDADTLPCFSLETVSVNEKNLEKKLRQKLLTTPNPARNYINLNKQGEIYLYNILGKQAFRGYGNKIDAKNLPAGIYYLFLKPENPEELILGPEKIILTK